MDPPATDLDGLERIEWEDLDGKPTVAARDVGFAATLVALAAGFLYYRYRVPDHKGFPYLGGWQPFPVDWVFLASLSAVGFYVVVPLIRDWERTLAVWRRLRTNRLAVAGLAWLAVVFVLGLFEPVIVGEIGFNPLNQPPVGVSLDALLVGSCVGPVVEGACHGSLAHPLGTGGNGRDVLELVVAGMRVAVEISVITATFIVPVGIAVGTVAGYVGGRVDDLLMRYVDVQQTIPALFIYMVAQFIYGPSLLLMVVVFGLLNWGDLARLVRSETLQKRDSEYVLAARSAGSSRLQVIRRHVVPNVSTTALTATALQLPTLVLVETTLSYLSLGDPRLVSWGNVVSVGIIANSDPTNYWWTPVFPIVALVLTAVSMNVVGSALQDALDPRRQ